MPLPSCSQVIRAASGRGKKKEESSRGRIFKCRLSVCNQTESIHVTHLPCDIIHESFQPDPTSITSLSQLFSLSSCSATCLHSASFCCVSSQQSPAKSNLPPLLMGCDIALIVSVAQRRLQNVANRRLTPTSALSTIPFGRSTIKMNPIKSPDYLSNYIFFLYGAAIINAFPFVREVESQLCTWSQMIQLSRAYCLHACLFVVQSKP